MMGQGDQASKQFFKRGRLATKPPLEGMSEALLGTQRKHKLDAFAPQKPH